MSRRWHAADQLFEEPSTPVSGAFTELLDAMLARVEAYTNALEGVVTDLRTSQGPHQAPRSHARLPAVEIPEGEFLFTLSSLEGTWLSL